MLFNKYYLQDRRSKLKPEDVEGTPKEWTDWEEGDMSGEISIEESVMGEEYLHEGSAGFSSII